MIDQEQGELFPEQSPTPDDERKTSGDDDLSPRVKERIEELSRRNVELEKLLNMDKKIDNVSNQQAQAMQMQQQALLAQQQQIAAQRNAQNGKGDDWTGWLDPKIRPIIEPELQRRDAVINQLGDRLDKVNTMLQFPEYASDPELQATVDNLQRERANATGYVFSRADILTYMRGQDRDKYAQQKIEELKTKPEGNSGISTGPRRAQGTFVEGSSPVSSRRPVNAPNKPFNDWSVEEMEKFLKDNPEYLKG